LLRWDEKKDYFLTIQKEIALGKKALKVNQKEVSLLNKQAEIKKTSERIEKISEVLVAIEKDLCISQQDKKLFEEVAKEVRQKVNPEITRILDALDTYHVLSEKTQTLDSLQETHKQFELAHKQLSDKADVIKISLTRLTEEQNSLKDASNQGIVIDQAVQVLKEKAKQLEQMIAKKQAYVEYQKQVDVQALSLKTAHEVYQEKSEKYEHLYETFIAEQVGIIAENLVEGNPCPVCGSLNHPNKASKSDLAVTQKSVDDAKKERNNSEKRVEEINKLFNEAKSKFEQEASYLEREGKRLIDPAFSLTMDGLAWDNIAQDGLNQIDTEIIDCNKALAQKSDEQKRIHEKIVLFENNSRRLNELHTEENDLILNKEKVVEAMNESKMQLSNCLVEVQGLKKTLPFETIQLAQEQLTKLKRTLEKAESDEKVSHERYLDLTNKKEKNNGVLKAEETAKTRQTDERSLEQASYIQELSSQGFFNESDYRESYKEEPLIISLEKEYQTYRDETIKLQETLKTYAEQTEGKVRIELSELKTKVIDLTIAFNTLTEQSKTIFSVKETNVNASMLLTALFGKRKVLKADYEVLSNLEKTANGNLSGVAKIDFQTFIQRRYFEHIIHEANKRLHVMSGEQFVLRCRDVKNLGAQGEVGLDLDVYSMINDKTRDVKTLSGGESFMASLSMALGMADVIQHTAGKIHIDTMFIDEGFGSLDDDTREQAIQILNGLAEGKRLVGIISHVTELKERIGQKLIVTKDEKGSRIRWEQQ